MLPESNKKTVFQIIQELKNTSSSNEKLAILNANKDNVVLQQVFLHALSPRIKFYIKKIPDYITSPLNDLNNQDGELLWAIDELKLLYTRCFTGKDAIYTLKHTLEDISKDNAFIIERIIERDLKCGVNTALVNKTWKNLIPETPYMGCKPYSKKLIENLFKTDKKGVVSQKKVDGRYNNLIILDDTITSESRQGETVYLNDNFDNIFKKEGLSNIVLNGELIIPNVSRYKSNGMISSIISINKKIKNHVDVKKDIIKFEKKYNTTLDLAIDSIHYVCWDVITYEEYLNAYSDNDYDYRLEHLAEVITKLDNLKVTALETKRLNSIEDVKTEFIYQLNNGEEGICVKGLSTKWKDGKGNGQIKVKEEIMLDLVIVSYNYGTKGTKNENVISSLNVESSDGLLKTSPTGITEERMEYITQNMDNLLNTIVTVKCSGISQDVNGNYSLLHPVFDTLRDDKLIANSLQECFEIVEANRQV